MGEPRPVVDVIADQVVERIRSEFEARIGAVVDTIAAEAQRRVNDVLSTDLLGIPESGGNDPVSPRADAKDRARRTAIQGLVATVAVAGIMAVAGAFQGGFDFLDAGAWKTVAGTAMGAMLMAVGAYFQRLSNPPKGQ